MRTIPTAILLALVGILPACRVDVYDEPMDECVTGTCGRVPLQVSYTMGTGWRHSESTVVIEAYDNAWFEGEAIASTTITTVAAANNGATMLYLPPGEYYIRGYTLTCRSSYNTDCYDQEIDFHGTPEYVVIEDEAYDTTTGSASVSVDLEISVSN